MSTLVSLISLALFVPLTSHGLDYWTAIGVQFNNIVSSMFVTFLLMCVFYLGIFFLTDRVFSSYFAVNRTVNDTCSVWFHINQ